VTLVETVGSLFVEVQARGRKVAAANFMMMWMIRGGYTRSRAKVLSTVSNRVE
jgi:uncharacterized membrane-anchored protein YitT (DUF2179 family)